jgi:competence protein ComGC
MKTRIFFRGNDRGNATLMALVVILIFSLVYLSLVPRIVNLKNLANHYKAEVLETIKKTNSELIQYYDLY